MLPPIANECRSVKAHCLAEIDAVLEPYAARCWLARPPLLMIRLASGVDPEVDDAEAEDLWRMWSSAPPLARYRCGAVAWNAWLDLNLYSRLPCVGRSHGGAILRRGDRLPSLLR
jgi:hypothetical protein